MAKPKKKPSPKDKPKPESPPAEDKPPRRDPFRYEPMAHFPGIVVAVAKSFSDLTLPAERFKDGWGGSRCSGRHRQAAIPGCRLLQRFDSWPQRCHREAHPDCVPHSPVRGSRRTSTAMGGAPRCGRGWRACSLVRASIRESSIRMVGQSATPPWGDCGVAPIVRRRAGRECADG